MTSITCRQPQGVPAGGQFAPTFRSEPGITLISQASTETARRAAAEAEVLARRRVFLQDQIDMVMQQQRSLACAAASHHVLERHPDAEVLVFSVKDGRAVMLSTVLDGAGRQLPARRTGEWADTVTNEISREPAGALTTLDGVEAAGTTLRINIRAVVAAVAPLVSEDTARQPRHAANDRTVA